MSLGRAQNSRGDNVAATVPTAAESIHPMVSIRFTRTPNNAQLLGEGRRAQLQSQVGEAKETATKSMITIAKANWKMTKGDRRTVDLDMK